MRRKGEEGGFERQRCGEEGGNGKERKGLRRMRIDLFR